MQATALDTLERADIPPAQARAFVEAIDIEVTAMQGTQATKLDVAVLSTDLRGEMARLSTDLRAEMAQLANELRREMAQLSKELRGEMAELKVEMKAVESRLVRWVFTVVLGQTAVQISAAFALLHYFRSE